MNQKKIYLLAVNHYLMDYFFDKQSAQKKKDLQLDNINDSILELSIEEDLFNLLKSKHVENPNLWKNQSNLSEIKQEYIKKRENFLKNPPEWHIKSGTRIYVVFNLSGACFWSPSGNNINSIIQRSPDSYISKEIRLEIDRQTYINLMSCFEFEVDNF